MTTDEADQVADLRMAAIGTSEAREIARLTCRGLLSAAEGSLDFRAEIRAILTSLTPSQPPPQRDRYSTIQQISARLLVSRGLPLTPELVGELAEHADTMDGPVSLEERAMLLLWQRRPELFSARRWKRLLTRFRTPSKRSI